MPVNHCHAAFLTNHYLNPNPSHLQTCSFLIITHQSNPHSQTLSNKPTPKQPTTITMESLKQGVNYVAETVQQAASGASKETNKQVAKDSNAPIGTRYVFSTSITATPTNNHPVPPLPRTPCPTRPTRRPMRVRPASTRRPSKFVLIEERHDTEITF